MILGIPRGFFYYDYIEFINNLFAGTGVSLLIGEENDEEILARGKESAVDEACFPIKLFAGQVKALCGRCDQVLIPRIMKDCSGRWLCPKLLGLPELLNGTFKASGLLVTEPLFFHDERKLKRALNRMCKSLNIPHKRFQKNFKDAYAQQKNVAKGFRTMYTEAAWEFMPPAPEEGEIILPDLGKVLITGHCYNVCDRFANGDIMRKLDQFGIGTVTEHQVTQKEKEQAIETLSLIKKPFWEAFVRIIGTALCLRREVEGIVYLSSFSCGLDAFLVEMLKDHVPELPLLVLKLDEHKGEAGFETRLEAFVDLLEKRRAS